MSIPWRLVVALQGMQSFLITVALVAVDCSTCHRQIHTTIQNEDGLQSAVMIAGLVRENMDESSCVLPNPCWKVVDPLELNKTPPTILLRERQPHLATLSSGAGKTVEPFY